MEIHHLLAVAFRVHTQCASHHNGKRNSDYVTRVILIAFITSNDITTAKTNRASSVKRFHYEDGTSAKSAGRQCTTLY